MYGVALSLLVSCWAEILCVVLITYVVYVHAHVQCVFVYAIIEHCTN